MNIALGLIKEEEKELNPDFSKEELVEVDTLIRLIKK